MKGLADRLRRGGKSESQGMKFRKELTGSVRPAVRVGGGFYIFNFQFPIFDFGKRISYLRLFDR